jgi:hypothetical protein
MSVPQYDIFRGRHDESPTWVEAVDDSAVANERMQYHALQNPGPYFIFCHLTRRILASIDTSDLSDVSERKSA